MGSTNTTTYYNLSQFIGTDKPAWLQDYNGDMLKIDTAINAAKLAADAAALDAGAAQNTADGAVSSIATLNSTVSAHTTDITNLYGAVNTINSLIGNGTPTTTDQTIIGAINEINASVTAHTYGAEVELTSGTPYVCPSDGYIVCRSGGDATSTSLIKFASDGNPVIGITNVPYMTSSVYVHKGTTVYPTTSNSGNVHFIPLS